jgi:hypothetical protein
MHTNATATRGFPIFTLAFVALFIGKVAGWLQITWFIVFLPLLIGLGMFVGVIGIVALLALIALAIN